MTVTADHLTARVFINGRWLEDELPRRDVLNPANEQIVGNAVEGTVEHVLASAAAAKAAQPAWAATPIDERASLLEDLAAAIRANQAELARVTTVETGLPPTGAARRVSFAAKLLDDTAAEARRLQTSYLPERNAPGPRGLQPINAAVSSRPVGVVACITPFNGPIIEVAGKVGPALVMGNTVVIKPAAQNPLAVARFVELCALVGFPPGTVNLVPSSDPAVSAALCASPDVNMISFTGSTAVGEAIYRSSADGIKRLLLELGGKGACIVLEDADLDLAADVISTVWTEASGQICAAPTRVIADESIHDALVERLISRSAMIKQGTPGDDGVTMGPVISEVQRDRIEGFVSRAVAEGATLTIGGRRPEIARGFYVAPTLLTDCTQEMEAVRHEIFGPVVTLQRSHDVAEAIRLANDSDFGLVNYVFGSTERARRVADQLDSGVVLVNFAGFVEGIPIGGYKRSGIGRAHGGEIGLRAYAELTSVVWPS